MFKKNSLTLYSAWPPISFSSAGQTHNLADTDKQFLKNPLLIDQLELEWSLKIKNDQEIDGLMNDQLKKFKVQFHDMKEVSREFSNIDPYNFKKINQKKLTKIKSIKSYLKKDNSRNIKNSTSIDLINEINSLYSLIQLNTSEDKIEKFLDNAKFLFKGYSGVGINYFICKKI
jgi:hypothetical protein